MILVYITIAWLAGIVLGRASTLDWWVWLLLLAPASLGIVIARKGSEQHRLNPWGILFVCLAGLSLGAARLIIAQPTFGPADLASYNDQGFVTVEGIVIDAPDVRDNHINLLVRAETLTLPDGQTREVKGDLLAQVPHPNVYRYGDPVVLQGELRTPSEFEGFSYKDYLARQRIYSLMQYTQAEVSGPRRGSPIRAAMFDFRDRANAKIMKLLPDPQASLLAGILLGIESGISPDVQEAFNRVGATHVIVISGSNLVILAGVIQNTLRRFFSERLASAVTIIGILAYAVFVGGDAAVIRAAIMVTLSIAAPLFGRETYGPASLAFAVLLMTAVEPLTLWDVSFQLSALATLGLIVYVGPLEALLEKGLSALFAAETAKKIVGAVSESFVVTVAAQITTTPVIVYYFGRLSAVSLLVNLLIIPAQTPLMVLGGIAVIVSLVIEPLGQLLAWGSWLFLSYTTTVVRLFARVPFASLAVEDVSPAAIWGIYIMIFGVTMLAAKKDTLLAHLRESLKKAFGLKLAIGAGLIAAILLWVGVFALPDGRLHVTFVDVGESSATIVVTPSGRHILIEAGGSGRRLSTALGDQLPFWDRRLDMVILTQPGSSGVSALPVVLRRHRVDVLLAADSITPFSDVESVESALHEQHARIIQAAPGQKIDVEDGVALTILDTGVSAVEGEAGEPPVILLTYGDARILLAGSLSAEGEASLMAGPYAGEVTVLQIPRGGNRDGAGDEFLELTSPQLAILSVDAGNRLGLPHAETLARLETSGAQLYRTDQQGTIYLVTDGSLMWVRAAR